MSSTAETKPANWNLANQITAARLLVSVLLFVTLAFHWYGVSLFLFILGASTDWIDGYIARSRNLVTQIGRIMDPLADKIIIAGTFIFLSAIPESGIPAWMTVVVICREFVVTVLRSFMEQTGTDFSAKMPGKIKMVLQCAAAVASLILLISLPNAPGWLTPTVTFLAWAMVLSTLYSGWLYIVAAGKILRDM